MKLRFDTHIVLWAITDSPKFPQQVRDSSPCRPFDQMLVAQALTEPLRLVSHDATVARYGDSVMLL